MLSIYYIVCLNNQNHLLPQLLRSKSTNSFTQNLQRWILCWFFAGIKLSRFQVKIRDLCSCESPYRGLVAVLVSNVSDGNRFSLGRDPGERALSDYRYDWRVASKVAGRTLLLSRDAVVGFKAETKQFRQKQLDVRFLEEINAIRLVFNTNYSLYQRQV